MIMKSIRKMFLFRVAHVVGEVVENKLNIGSSAIIFSIKKLSIFQLKSEHNPPDYTIHRYHANAIYFCFDLSHLMAGTSPSQT